MRSSIRSFALSAVAAASQRPVVTTEPNSSQSLFRFKTAHLFLLLGLMAPVHSFASSEAPYCIAVDGGFGNGGTTFVARNFSLPAASKCTPWTGYTKTAASVILTTNGTSCLSSDNKALTVSVSSADPSFLGPGEVAANYLQLSREDATEPFTGQDLGAFAGSAEAVSCTSDLLTLPSSHN